jgi:hypothetical protein
MEQEGNGVVDCVAFRACQFLSVAEVSFAIRAKYSRMSLT